MANNKRSEAQQELQRMFGSEEEQTLSLLER